MNRTADPRFSALLAALVERRGLSAEQMQSIFKPLLAGEWGDGEAAAMLIAMRMKGESAIELAAAARCLRERMVRFDTGRPDVIDTCGTGGDDLGTFNISTAAALVVAAAGVPVVKHGNRAVTSRCGSADVLTELGVSLGDGPEDALESLHRCGFAFCFAPNFHPILKQLAPLRQRLGVRTILNLLGPLANPANAAYQLLGVGRRDLLDPMAGALADLGIRRAFVVCSEDGMDEVSLSAPTHFRRVDGAAVTQGVWQPSDFGLPACRIDDLQAANAQASAQIIENILRGQSGPAAHITVANATAALWAAERATNLASAVALAQQAISTGRAMNVLERLRERR